MKAKEKPPVKKKVLLVDDHPVMRQGLGQLIDQEPDLMVCGEAEDQHSALAAIEKTKPDIAVVDISLKNSSGIELMKDIHIRWPKLPALVLSMHDESFYAERVLRAGARGYVTKAEAPAKLIAAIRQVLAGGLHVSEKLAAQMIGKMVNPGGRGGDGPGLLIDRLSDREFEVFELIGQGIDLHDIAQRLHLSVKTIEAHRENIKKKLSMESSIDLLKYAIQWNQFERGT